MGRVPLPLAIGSVIIGTRPLALVIGDYDWRDTMTLGKVPLPLAIKVYYD